ncbi:hypothetical protein PR048_007600 [Dryococelus australis]|uniref:Rab-GAP TBC domain-containing protein n=1 Tax=Dryococelus australis TaxID=614101 RepID=A0ABQ9HWC6_9NEOP|nr:hypothetical protein PR048_007600 [Dryococelus australis]
MHDDVFLPDRHNNRSGDVHDTSELNVLLRIVHARPHSPLPLTALSPPFLAPLFQSGARTYSDGHGEDCVSEQRSLITIMLEVAAVLHDATVRARGKLGSLGFLEVLPLSGHFDPVTPAWGHLTANATLWFQDYKRYQLATQTGKIREYNVVRGRAVVDWSYCSLTTKVNQVRFSAGPPGRFSHVGNVVDAAVGHRVFSWLSRFSHPCIPLLLCFYLASFALTGAERRPKALSLSRLSFPFSSSLFLSTSLPLSIPSTSPSLLLYPSLRLARSPPVKANRVQSPTDSPDFRKWESCRTMSLVSRFSRGSPVSPAHSSRRCSIFTSITLIGSQHLAVKSRPNLFTLSPLLTSLSSLHVVLSLSISHPLLLSSHHDLSPSLFPPALFPCFSSPSRHSSSLLSAPVQTIPIPSAAPAVPPLCPQHEELYLACIVLVGTHQLPCYKDTLRSTVGFTQVVADECPIRTRARRRKLAYPAHTFSQYAVTSSEVMVIGSRSSGSNMVVGSRHYMMAGRYQSLVSSKPKHLKLSPRSTVKVTLTQDGGRATSQHGGWSALISEPRCPTSLNPITPVSVERARLLWQDLHRTGCSLFCGAAAEENQALLKRVLLAYARWNKAVGYCQGFNMLAALILQVMDRSESDAVKVRAPPPCSSPLPTTTSHWDCGDVAVAARLRASHLGEPGLNPDGVALGFSHMGIVPDDVAACRRVFSGTFHSPRPYIPALLHTLVHPHGLSRPQCYQKPRSLSFTPRRAPCRSAATHLMCQPGGALSIP